MYTIPCVYFSTMSERERQIASWFPPRVESGNDREAPRFAGLARGLPLRNNQTDRIVGSRYSMLLIISLFTHLCEFDLNNQI